MHSTEAGCAQRRNREKKIQKSDVADKVIAHGRMEGIMEDCPN